MQSNILKNSEFMNRMLMILSFLTVSSFLLAFFYLPIVKIFSYAFTTEDGFSFATFTDVLSSSLNQKAISFSLVQSLLSAILCLFFGFPLGYFLAKYTFKGRNVIINLLTVPFVLPPIVVLLGFIIVFGPSGWLNQFGFSMGLQVPIFKLFGTWEGILLAHVFYNLSVIIRMTIPAWQNVDTQLIEVAQTLGASKWHIFWHITFPQMKNYFVSALLMVVTYCFNSYTIVLYMGQAQFQTIEVRVYKLFTSSLDFEGGASLALIQITINILILLVYIYFERRTRKMAIGKESSFLIESINIRSKSPSNRVFIYLNFIYLLIISCFIVLPMLAVIIVAFTPYSPEVSIFWGFSQLFTSKSIPILGSSPLRLLWNTLIFATVSTLITLLLSIGILFLIKNRYQALKDYKQPYWESFISFFALLPMVSSSVVLAIGLFLQFHTGILFQRFTWILIVMAHVLISIPFVTRSLLSAYNRIDLELLNIAATLGGSRLQIFRKIELPLVKRGLTVGGIFAFAISIGEFGATNFLSRADYGTISTGISKLLFSRTLQLPASMATILILLTFGAFYLIQKLGDAHL